MTSLAPSRETPTAPTGRRYVQLVMVLGALIALGPLSIDMYLPAFPRIADDLSASDSAVQLTLTGMLLGLAVGQLVIGPLSDAFGRRRPLVIGLAAHAGASLLCAVAPTVGVYRGCGSCRALAGGGAVGGGDGDRPGPVLRGRGGPDHVAADAGDRAARRSWRRPSAGSCWASPPGAASSWCWPGPRCCSSWSPAVGIRETLPESRRRPATVGATLAAYRTLLGDRVFVALTFIGGSMMAAMFAYVSGRRSCFQDGFGLDARTFGLVFGLNAAGLTLTSQLNPVLLRRLHMSAPCSPGRSSGRWPRRPPCSRSA